MSISYAIRGMHCAACVARIEAALEPLTRTATVTLNPPLLVLGDDAPAYDDLQKAIAKAGDYSLSPVATTAPVATISWLKTYAPLLLILGLLAVVSFKGAVNIESWMMHFMAGFFIVFAFFKLLNLRGFADAYASYDLLAAKIPVYGLVYPFLELGLGMAFLFGIATIPALWFSMILMGFSSLGVINALRQKRKIRCACLGTTLNLPMSSITLIEDLGMVAMAGWMLLKSF